MFVYRLAAAPTGEPICCLAMCANSCVEVVTSNVILRGIPAFLTISSGVQRIASYGWKPLSQRTFSLLPARYRI
jgi:hypothetical protein